MMLMRFLGLPEDEWQCWMCSQRSHKGPSNLPSDRKRRPSTPAWAQVGTVEVVDSDVDVSQYTAQGKPASPVCFEKCPELQSYDEREDDDIPAMDVNDDDAKKPNCDDTEYLEEMNRCRVNLKSTVKKQRMEMNKSCYATASQESQRLSGVSSESMSPSVRGMTKPIDPPKGQSLRQMTNECTMGAVITQSGRCVHRDAEYGQFTSDGNQFDFTPAIDSGEDSDGGSDLASHGRSDSRMQVDDLYQRSAGRFETIKQIMHEEGIVTPIVAQQLYESSGYSSKQGAAEMDKISQAWSSEVEHYQGVMRAKFKHLGARDSDNTCFGDTANPATAVRDAVGRYHVLCEELGEYYAMPGAREADLTGHQREQLRKFVQRLGAC